MLDFLRGTIVYRDFESVVLEVQGIGFRVLLPGFVEIGHQAAPGAQIQLFVSLHANLDRPNPFLLVGFRTTTQREFFETFLGVSGIGPRGAVKALVMPMEATATAIEQADLKLLKSLPGIGIGKAKKIIAELQGKMAAYGKPGPVMRDSGESILPAGDYAASNELVVQVQVALEGLGYTGSEIRDIIRKIMNRNPEVATVEEFLREVFAGD